MQETRLNPGPVELLHHMLYSGDQQSKDSHPSWNLLLGKHLKWKEEFDVLSNWRSHVLPLFVFLSVTPWRQSRKFSKLESSYEKIILGVIRLLLDISTLNLPFNSGALPKPKHTYKHALNPLFHQPLLNSGHNLQCLAIICRYRDQARITPPQSDDGWRRNLERDIVRYRQWKTTCNSPREYQ